MKGKNDKNRDTRFLCSKTNAYTSIKVNVKFIWAFATCTFAISRIRAQGTMTSPSHYELYQDDLCLYESAGFSIKGQLTHLLMD